jgi:hypothetical protein
MPRGATADPHEGPARRDTLGFGAATVPAARPRAPRRPVARARCTPRVQVRPFPPQVGPRLPVPARVPCIWRIPARPGCNPRHRRPATGAERRRSVGVARLACKHHGHQRRGRAGPRRGPPAQPGHTRHQVDLWLAALRSGRGCALGSSRERLPYAPGPRHGRQLMAALARYHPIRCPWVRLMAALATWPAGRGHGAAGPRGHGGTCGPRGHGNGGTREASGRQRYARAVLTLSDSDSSSAR